MDAFSTDMVDGDPSTSISGEKASLTGKTSEFHTSGGNCFFVVAACEDICISHDLVFRQVLETVVEGVLTDC